MQLLEEHGYSSHAVVAACQNAGHSMASFCPSNLHAFTQWIIGNLKSHSGKHVWRFVFLRKS